MFKCKEQSPECMYESNSAKGYEIHWRNEHYSLSTSQFACGVRKCSRRFKNYSTFATHIFRDHDLKQKGLPKPRALEVGVVTCHNCGAQFHLISDLTKHLKIHFDGNSIIQCHYPNCPNKYAIYSSLTAHVRYIHSRAIVRNTRNIVSPKSDRTANAVTVGPGIINSLSPDLASSNDGDSEHGALHNNTCLLGMSPSKKNTFIRKMALFYLTLVSKNHVPEQTTQIVHDEITTIMTSAMEMLAKDVSNKLAAHVDKDVLHNIIYEVFYENQFTALVEARNPLRSKHMRQKYYQQHFRYVRPVEMSLGLNALNENVHMHYVPILQSLKALLDDDSINKQLREHSIRMPGKDSCFVDIHDGSKMKTHALFSNDHTALKIILFQDEFVIANPLGSSKRNLKMTGVYYTLSNIHPWNRSKVDQIQLVLLVKSKDLKYLAELGQEKVYGPLINDLKTLETKGITSRGQTIRGSLAYITGDNLGSHFIGGFLESFGKTHYFCRVCAIKRADFDNGIKFGPIRTKESYEESVAALSGERGDSVNGIKGSSLFNTLQYYHVIDGLPPCIGHDIFEGIAQYDLPLALQYFEDKGWLDLVQLNRRIEKFQYKQMDSRDKPCPISISGKLGGHAVQTWTLIRLLPLLIGENIRDKKNQVWRMVVSLIRLVQITCSPVANYELISLLQETIQQYMDIRKAMFPNSPLRPKHHYIEHYPRLITAYGPLVRLWTMRYESKHRYFKECQKASKNTINVTKTLAEKHQYMQAGYCANGYFGEDAVLTNGTAYYPEVFSRHINKALVDARLDQDDLMIGSQCTFRGTHYGRDDVVILQSDIDLEMLKIITIAATGKDNINLFLIGKKAHGIYVEEMGVYRVEETNFIICASIHDLQDYQPYPVYESILPYPVLALKHLTS